MLYIMYLGINFDWSLLYPIVVLIVTSSILYFFLNEERQPQHWFKEASWGYLPVNTNGWAVSIITSCLVILLFVVSNIGVTTMEDMLIRAVPYVTLVVITYLLIAQQTSKEIPVEPTPKPRKSPPKVASTSSRKKQV